MYALLLFLIFLPLNTVQATNYSSPVIDNSQFTGLRVNITTSANSNTVLDPSSYNLTIELFYSTGADQIFYNTSSISYADGHTAYKLTVQSVEQLCIQITDVPSRTSFKGNCPVNADNSINVNFQAENNTTDSTLISPLDMSTPLLALLVIGVAKLRKH